MLKLKILAPTHQLPNLMPNVCKAEDNMSVVSMMTLPLRNLGTQHKILLLLEEPNQVIDQKE
ncbi:hypothetical protein H5410_022096 [Solanum commersonii]|uniref:Uncharacterized protein n=1 Tax=Solanum commersonii TaxID=4109 RepID=A0A9J5ZFS5_SOLCO|nr:hypothetical protein H5410_022096 [Solanum commersonii]